MLLHRMRRLSARRAPTATCGPGDAMLTIVNTPSPREGHEHT